MFKKINGPAHEHAGPSLGHSTENGDSWHTAVAKINDNFADLEKRLEKIDSDKPEIKQIVDNLNELKAIVSRVTDAVDAMTVRVASIESAIQQPDPAPSTPPQQPPSQGSAS